MTRRGQTAGANRSNKLDSKAYVAMFRETSELADKVLERYGEPQVTLAELRRALDERLGDFSLGEWVVKEREAGW